MSQYPHVAFICVCLERIYHAFSMSSHMMSVVFRNTPQGAILLLMNRIMTLKMCSWMTWKCFMWPTGCCAYKSFWNFLSTNCVNYSRIFKNDLISNELFLWLSCNPKSKVNQLLSTWAVLFKLCTTTHKCNGS
jgi:hypothetical protein